MENDPRRIALSLYEVAAPIFVSLKDEVKPTDEEDHSHPDAKELTFTQLRVLMSIEFGRDQVGILARRAKVAQPAMSKIVDHLINLELVRRDPHPTDRRQIKLSLTPQGLATTERVRLAAAQKYVGAISELSPNDRAKMAEGIALIREVIERTRKEEL